MIFPALAFAVVISAPQCLAPSGQRITTADIAKAVPEFAKLPGETVFGYAPQPGATRVVSPAELMQWLSRRGIQSEVRDALCFRWELTPLDPEQIRASIAAGLPEGSSVSVIETSAYGVPAGELVFPPAGLQTRRGDEASLWKGFVRYAGSAKYDIWARVDLRVPFQRVVAAEDIKGGTVIEASMLRVESGEGPPVSTDTLAAIEQAAGRTARRLITAGSPVVPSALDKPLAVRKGDVVHVSVISGAARIAFDGTADGPAGVGELVGVKLTDTGKLIRAQVLSSGQAVLDLNAPGRKIK